MNVIAGCYGLLCEPHGVCVVEVLGIMSASVAVLLQALVEYLPMWSVTQHSYMVEWGRFSIVTSLVVGSTTIIEACKLDVSSKQVISYSANVELLSKFSPFPQVTVIEEEVACSSMSCSTVHV